VQNSNIISGVARHRSKLKSSPLVAGLIVLASVSGAALAQTALVGSDLVLPASAPSNADMIILKTEDGGSGRFAILVTNTGFVSVTGAAVTDSGGLNGTCPKTNSVTITGGGVPAGNFTVADLSGAGITLGTLASGQSAKISYSCGVN
jgi:hypothetical protein